MSAEHFTFPKLQIGDQIVFDQFGKRHRKRFDDLFGDHSQKPAYSKEDAFYDRRTYTLAGEWMEREDVVTIQLEHWRNGQSSYDRKTEIGQRGWMEISTTRWDSQGNIRVVCTASFSSDGAFSYNLDDTY